MCQLQRVEVVNVIVYTHTVLHITYSGPYFLLRSRGMMEMWEVELLFLGFLSLAHSLPCLSLSLLTSTGNRAIRNVPVPQCPLKHLQMYSAPICHSWECGGVSSYV